MATDSDKRRLIIQRHRGSDVQRQYVQREAKRPTFKHCRGCHDRIQIGQLYWDYHGDIRYHDLCFKENFGL